MGRGENNHGPSVLDGVVLRTSVSALTAFDPESYGGCPRRWWWTRVAGEKEPETVAQKSGTDGHAECEAYLKTGSDVLGPVARAGKHLLPRPGDDLVVEAQFGDLGAAIEVRRALVVCENTQERATLREVLVEAAGLVAGDIPLDGYIDLRHARGEYVDGSGLVQPERSEHGVVVEVADHKFTSSIEKFSKGPTEMASTIQMVGYANYVLNTIPNVDHVRVSHHYFQTRGPKLAKKVTALLSARAARDGWRRVDELASYMEEVARAQRVEDVEPQLNSCEAYRGCPHLARCPITRKFGTGGSTMSLFNKTADANSANGSAQATTTQKQGSLFGSLLKKEESTEEKKTEVKTDDVAHRAAVEAEKQRLQAEERGERVSAASPGAKVAVTTCVMDKEYFVDCADGGKPRRMKYAGSSKGFYFFVDAQGGRAKLEVADDVFETAPGAGSMVTPNDAPKSALPGAAAPLKAEQIEKIDDPEVKKRAEDHARQVAEQATQQQQSQTQQSTAAEKTSGRCPEGGKKVALTSDDLATQTVTCSCGKDWKLKQAGAVKEGDAWFATLPAHNIKIKAPASAQAQTESVQQIAQQARQATQSEIVLYVDIAVERGPALTPLDSYYLPLVRELEEQHGAADIRCAPQDSPLGYSKWRGALAATVRAQPPAPGTYSVQSSSEVAQVVIETLAPMCAAVMRGVR